MDSAGNTAPAARKTRTAAAAAAGTARARAPHRHAGPQLRRWRPRGREEGTDTGPTRAVKLAKIPLHHKLQTVKKLGEPAARRKPRRGRPGNGARPKQGACAPQFPSPPASRARAPLGELRSPAQPRSPLWASGSRPRAGLIAEVDATPASPAAGDLAGMGLEAGSGEKTKLARSRPSPRVSSLSGPSQRGTGAASRSSGTAGVRRRRGAKGHSEGRGREAPGKEPGRRGRSSSSPPPPAPGIAARGERLTGGRWHTLGDGGDWPRLRGAPAAGCLSEGEGAETSPRLALPGSLGGWRLRIVPSREPGERGRGGPKERAVGKGLLEERRGHREARTGWRPAALPFFHPGELRKPQRAEAGLQDALGSGRREATQNGPPRSGRLAPRQGRLSQAGALKRDGMWFQQDLGPAGGSGERLQGAACKDRSEH
ncbi:unnamed protein product [Rangifer tarandus platyrhynchus]|uniref:Uncharacterized protein n=1 Tax=Rangifer tarandus platyrhynchus TaxID=3082113 RepID=A0ABN8YKP1_RANTA|nr:unnamed protein product [Rangifer tarandus platyrhynchus]